MTGAALGTPGMTRLPGPVRRALGRRRERVVVLLPTVTRMPALTGLPAPRRLRRRSRPVSQQHGDTLASLERVRREREESQAASGHQKSVFP